MGVQLVQRKRATGAALAVLALIAIVVSDGFVPAAHTDPNLVNGWGLVASGGSPWWVANNHTDTSTLYDSNGAAQGGPLVVGVEGGPTGIVFNGGSDFVIH